jgi:hypothetical protein
MYMQFWFLHDIGQRSAYKHKLLELPPGAYQRSSFPCTNKGGIKRSHTEEGVPQYKIIPKTSFLLRNLLVGQDPSGGTPLSGSYREEAVMEMLPPTSNHLRSHRVSHMHGFASKHCTIYFSSKNLILNS